MPIIYTHAFKSLKEHIDLVTVSLRQTFRYEMGRTMPASEKTEENIKTFRELITMLEQCIKHCEAVQEIATEAIRKQKASQVAVASEDHITRYVFDENGDAHKATISEIAAKQGLTDLEYLAYEASALSNTYNEADLDDGYVVKHGNGN